MLSISELWSKEANAGIFQKSEKSASAIAKYRTDELSPFSRILFNDGYLPNERLRKLLTQSIDHSQEKIVKSVITTMIKEYYSPAYFISDESTELKVCNDYFQKILRELMAKSSKQYHLTIKDNQTHLDKSKEVYPLKFRETHTFKTENNYFSNSCKTEPVIHDVNDQDVVFIGSEIKGLNTATLRCFAQAFIVCANAALKLLQCGMEFSDCVVPGICYAGDGFKFIAVYLVQDSWPVMVSLTNSLNVELEESRRRAAEWLVRIVAFAEETSHLYT